MASSLIATATLETLVQSGLPDDALEVLVDAADAEIVRAHGAHDGERKAHVSGRGFRIWLPQIAESVASVTEWGRWEDEADAQAVDSSTYSLEHGGRTIWRTEGQFLTNVAVTFTLQADTARRAQALVDLVKLEVVYSGKSSQRVGQLSETILDRDLERWRIIASVGQPYAGGGLLA